MSQVGEKGVSNNDQGNMRQEIRQMKEAVATTNPDCDISSEDLYLPNCRSACSPLDSKSRLSPSAVSVCRSTQFASSTSQQSRILQTQHSMRPSIAMIRLPPSAPSPPSTTSSLFPTILKASFMPTEPTSYPPSASYSSLSIGS